MRERTLIQPVVFTLILTSMLLTACGQSASPPTAEPVSVPQGATDTPEWFDIELTDVQNGETFTMNDYAGKVVLVETMAIWCPNCIIQATQVRKFHEALANPDDLISISLDVDVNEDEASLKEYASSYRLDWHFAVAPLGVARALGNLYSAAFTHAGHRSRRQCSSIGIWHKGCRNTPKYRRTLPGAISDNG